jgi:hypothetical protein
VIRTLLVGLLVFLAASCPLWCAKFESAHDDCKPHASHDQPEAPVPSPVNSDNCLCQGAVASPSSAPAVRALLLGECPPLGLDTTADLLAHGRWAERLGTWSLGARGDDVRHAALRSPLRC